MEEIAVIGIGCRLPGASTPELFWKLLLNGESSISPVPAERWKESLHCDYNKDGYSYSIGAVPNMNHFDTEFFEMSPREATSINPEHRSLLEVAWETFEDAGIKPSSVSGKKVGVFVGGQNTDIWVTTFLHTNAPGSYDAVGKSGSMYANRVSFYFNLTGPSLSIDTACSGSLNAIHLAVKSLWNGECLMALAGGSNHANIPSTTNSMSNAGVLSPDSSCKTFDADANGYVRSEGVAFTLLIPLSIAKKLNLESRIRCVILATNSNHCGKVSEGITHPSGEAQEQLMREAISLAKIDPKSVHYAEAHGTGTAVGDPVEARSISSVYCAEKRESPLYIGSVKSNVGHGESLAGVTGFIKALLCVENGILVPNINFKTPNPKIDFEKLQLKVVSQSLTWDQPVHKRMASVNSFGFGGSNCHIIIKGYDTPKVPSGVNNCTVKLIPLSAKSDISLKLNCSALLQYLKRNSESVTLDDVSKTYGEYREHFKHRACFVVDSIEKLLSELGDFTDSSKTPTTCVGSASSSRKTCFVFTGMGSQWIGMGKELFLQDEDFKKSIENFDAHFIKHSGWSIRETILAENSAWKLDKTAHSQPLIVAVQIGMLSMLKRAGIIPSFVIGHSVGELAAAYAAELLNLEDVAKIAHWRGFLQGKLDGTGTMLATSLSPSSLQTDFLEPLGLKNLCIAAINTKTSITVAGSFEDIQKLSDELNNKKIWNRKLDVKVPFHSPVTDAIKEELLQKLSSVSPLPWNTDKPLFFSTAINGAVDSLDANYWWNNVRNCVSFESAMEKLISLHKDVLFIEVGPHASLHRYVETICREMKLGQAKCVTTMMRDKPQILSIMNSIAQAWCLGWPVQWNQLINNAGEFRRDLPFYQFNNIPMLKTNERVLWYLFGDPLNHSLLAEKIYSCAREWQTRINLNQPLFKYLSDHKIGGMPVLPGAAFAEIGLALSATTNSTKVTEVNYPVGIDHLELVQGLLLNDPVILSINFQNPEFVISSRKQTETNTKWTVRAKGIISSSLAFSIPEFPKLSELMERMKSGSFLEFNRNSFYATLRRHGYFHSNLFQVLKSGWVKDKESLVFAELGQCDPNYIFHPALFDGVMQLGYEGRIKTLLPIELQNVKILKKIPNRIYIYAKSLQYKGDVLHKRRFAVYDETGDLCAFVKKVTWQETMGISGSLDADVRYKLKWIEDPAANLKISEKAEWQVHFYSRKETNPQEEKIAEKLEKYHSITKFDANKTANTQGLLFICPSSTDPTDTSPCSQLLSIVQSLLKNKVSNFTIIVATFGALTSSKETSIAGGSVIGFVRTAITECSNLKFKIVDLEPGKKAKKYSKILAYEMQSQNIADEDEVYWKSKVRYLHRLEAYQPATIVDPSSSCITLSAPQNNLLDSLHFSVSNESRTTPTSGHVEVIVKAIGLNFKDVLKATGKLPPRITDNTSSTTELGLEFSGVISKVSEGEKQWEVGDLVSASLPGCFKSIVTVPVNLLVKMPKNWSIQESAALQVVFSTAWHALYNVAHLQKGETVLIHAAVGGVGLAAIQIAKYLGAGEIFVTAGSEEKREYLKSMGLKYIFSSRTVEFHQEIMRITNDRGVDVVLSAQPGDIMQASVAALVDGGRYCEIGKRDIEENSSLGMRRFNENIIFASIDMDKLILNSPAKYRSILDSLQKLVDEKHITPIPITAFNAEKVADAFKYLARSKHIGKVVVEFNLPMKVTPVIPKIRSDRSYMIIGGFGGFGMQTAMWLLDRGAKYIVLVGRAEPTPEQKENLFVLHYGNFNAEIRYRYTSTADANSANELIRETNEWIPIGGIFHSAMVSSDHTIDLQTADNFEKHWNSKVRSAWNLHEATKELRTIDLFVLYSSILSILGTFGNSAYAAANSALDSLARLRHAMGLPALAVQWGGISDVGILTRLRNETNSAIQGMASFSALSCLETCGIDNPIAGIFQVEWNRAFTFRKYRPFFSIVASPKTKEGKEELNKDSITEKYVLDSIIEFASNVLQLDKSRLNSGSRLQQLGLDSVTGVELRVLLERKFKIEVSIFDLMDSENFEKLASILFTRIHSV